MRKAVSVTLDSDNLVWLRAQASATRRGSLSEVLDAIVSSARREGRVEPAAMRSVVGTIDLPADDEALRGADGYVRALFDRSARRPTAVKEARATHRTRRRGRTRG